MLRAVDAGVPDDKPKALDFFMRLDEARYGDCKHDLLQWSEHERDATAVHWRSISISHWVRSKEASKTTLHDGGRERGRQANGCRGGARGSSTKKWSRVMDTGKKVVLIETALMWKKPSMKHTCYKQEDEDFLRVQLTKMGTLMCS